MCVCASPNARRRDITIPLFCVFRFVCHFIIHLIIVGRIFLDAMKYTLLCIRGFSTFPNIPFKPMTFTCRRKAECLSFCVDKRFSYLTHSFVDIFVWLDEFIKCPGESSRRKREVDGMKESKSARIIMCCLCIVRVMRYSFIFKSMKWHLTRFLSWFFPPSSSPCTLSWSLCLSVFHSIYRLRNSLGRRSIAPCTLTPRHRRLRCRLLPL